ncbi:WXG100 family type VII secretion target [Streptomyces sp. NBC_01341]|uniref:WXG100 family type VII secretion target n=1 Tax=Streptomyces sp. NBC_01341 TaxID=2903831 RepID=UPI002E0F20DC|nr:WXG100 family type VII secretion target [Streptomyces sp. NBC_01341]
MTASEFKVALSELHSAIGLVRTESGHVSDLINEIERNFNEAHTYWQSPSASTFERTSTWFTMASRELEALLAEMVRRMQTAYNNYVDAERANTHNTGG